MRDQRHKTPQVLTGAWEQAKGRIGGEQMRDTAAEAGTRRGVQRRVAEADGWRVWGEVQVDGVPLWERVWGAGERYW